MLTFCGVFELLLELGASSAEDMSCDGAGVGAALVGRNHHGTGAQVTQPTLPADPAESLITQPTLPAERA